jgi:hypothetical protein
LGREAAGSGAKRRWHDQLRRRGEEEDNLTSEDRMSARGKREGTKVKYSNLKGKRIRKNMPMTHEPSGRTMEAAAYKMGGPARGRLGQLGQIQGEGSIRN